MRKDKLFVGLSIFAVCLVLGLGAYSVTAVTGANIDVGSSSRMNLSSTTSGTQYDAQAGNVTQIDISGRSVTTHWAGFFGNISGNLSLEDAGGNVFYDWEGLGVPKGVVLASNASSITWSGVDCADATHFANIDSSLNLTGTDTDTVGKTYAAQSHPAFSIAGTPISENQCNSTNAYTDTGKSAALFSQILLADTLGNPIYTTVINSSQTSFTGAAVDFELLVGAKPTGITPIYFFIELQ